jgi:hypothetical protein
MSPDNCFSCGAESGVSVKWSLCGDPNHAVCIPCFASIAEASYNRRREDAIIFSQSFGDGQGVKCPVCRKTDKSTKYPDVRMYGDDSHLPPLPGQPVRVYDSIKMNEVDEWIELRTTKPKWLDATEFKHTLVLCPETYTCPFADSDPRHSPLCVFESFDSFVNHVRTCNSRPYWCIYCAQAIPISQGSYDHVRHHCSLVKCTRCSLAGPWAKIGLHLSDHK